MSFSYEGFMRICEYMIANDLSRKEKLGPASKPGSSGIGAIYKSQLQETCYNLDRETLHPAFRPSPPNDRTFRLVVDRIYENAIILSKEESPAEYVENLADPEYLREYAKYLPKFEELRSNSTEALDGSVPGLGLTTKALDNAITLTIKQGEYLTWSRAKMDRFLRLQMIEQLLGVAQVFSRPESSPSDRTWQQESAASILSDNQAVDTENDAIGSSSAGRRKGRKRSNDEDSEVISRNESIYRSAKEMRRNLGTNDPEGTPRNLLPSTDPISSSLTGVSAFLINKGKADDLAAKKQERLEQATRAFNTIMAIRSYKNQEDGKNWISNLKGIGIDSPDLMEYLPNIEDADVIIGDLTKALKMVPALVLDSYLKLLKPTVTPAVTPQQQSSSSSSAYSQR